MFTSYCYVNNKDGGVKDGGVSQCIYSPSLAQNANTRAERQGVSTLPIQKVAC